MALRDDLLRRIARKRTEVAGLEAQIGFAKAYIQATEDVLKLIAKEATGRQQPQRSLRKGSAPAKAYRALRSGGHALHIIALVEAIGKTVTRKSRGALASSLSAYARRGEIFTRPAPNTFGLVEFGETDDDSPSTADDGKQDFVEIPVGDSRARLVS